MPLVLVALAATGAGIALTSCTRTIELLEEPGEPAVVVAVETRHVDKRRQAFIDLRAEDGTLWTHKGDRDLVDVVRPGHRTTMHREGGMNTGADHPAAIIAEERDDRLWTETVGRAVTLLGVSPGLALIAVAVLRRGQRRRHLWAHGRIAEGAIVGFDAGRPSRISYRFRTEEGEDVDGSMLASVGQLQRMGGAPRPGMTAWVLHAPEAPRRNVLYSAEPAGAEERAGAAGR